MTGVRLATAAGMLLVFREEEGGAWRAYESTRTSQLGAFLRTHPRPYVHILDAWGAPDPALDLYLCDEGGVRWVRATVRLRPWPPP